MHLYSEMGATSYIHCTEPNFLCDSLENLRIIGWLCLEGTSKIT